MLPHTYRFWVHCGATSIINHNLRYFVAKSVCRNLRVLRCKIFCPKFCLCKKNDKYEVCTHCTVKFVVQWQSSVQACSNGFHCNLHCNGIYSKSKCKYTTLQCNVNLPLTPAAIAFTVTFNATLHWNVQWLERGQQLFSQICAMLYWSILQLQYEVQYTVKHCSCNMK